MKRITLIVSFFYFCCSALSAQTYLYHLDGELPTNTPRIFAPGVVSKENRSEFGSIFSANGSEFFFAVEVNGKAEIRYSKLDNGSWTTPKIIIGDATYGYNDPMLSPDEKRLYYISDRPKNAEKTDDYDIWYSEKRANDWSEPINAGNMINSSKNEYYISFASDGTMYYSSNKNAKEGNQRDYDIYSSEEKNGIFQKSKRLSGAINTNAYEADVFIAPDKSYIIFCSVRPEGLGRGDLYISHKQENGEWSNAKSLKNPINTEKHELCPWVTNDGKYFLYTSNQDIYWVSTKAFQK